MGWLELYAQLKVYEWVVGAVCGGTLVLAYVVFLLVTEVVIPVAKHIKYKYRP
jgi:hypothetical protein